MGQFVYYIPGRRGVISPADLDKIGLGHMHDGLQPDCRDSSGPDGGQGVLVTFQRAQATKLAEATVLDGAAAAKVKGTKMLYSTDAQTWVGGPVDGDGAKPRWWVGFWNEHRPSPAELARRRFIAGIDVPMLDGAGWTIPIARSLVRLTSLPKKMKLGPDGKKWKPVELPEFMALCTEAEWAFDRVSESYRTGTLAFDWDRAMQLVVAALTTNYRVTATEISLLELVGDTAIVAVFEAVCDWQAFLAVREAEVGEGQASEPSSTASGSEADSPAISPPSAT